MDPRDRARDLRRDMSSVEGRLWLHLRNRQINGEKFRRQVTIGRYVVDFVCHERRLVVELDGETHLGREEADRARTAVLEAAGFQVIRFWNNDVMGNIEGVVEAIAEALANAANGERL